MSRAQHVALGRRIGVPFVVGIMAAAASLVAQDARTVKEPVLPPACITLKAALTTASATSGDIETRAFKAGAGQQGLDTARLQQALDHCDKGKAVELVADGANAAFLTGPVALRPGVTLLVDIGVTLYASRNPEHFALAPGSCGVVNDDSGTGCRPLITVKSATGSAIMGDGSIDGQGGGRLVIDGKLSAQSWWDLGDQAHTAGREQSPRMIDADLTDDFTLYRITLKNSPNRHVAYHRGDGFTVWGVRIDTPKTARNTDGIDISQSKNVTITQSFIRTGDDNIAIKAGDGPTLNITLNHNRFYWGHGLSIGTETNGGISGIRVEDLSLDGPDNGLHIKSDANHGGLVEDVTYQDVCIRNSKNPILFDSTYSFPGKAAITLPVYRDITLHDVRILGGGRVQFNGFDNTHRIGVTLDGVLALDPPTRYRAQASHTDLTFGPGPVNMIFTGDDSTVSGKQVNGNLPACTAMFVPFP
jgi:polygalacturonase